MSYEVQLQSTLRYHSLGFGKDSLPDSKLVLAENGRDVSDFRLTIYKRSDYSHLRNEQQLLYFKVATKFKILYSRLGLSKGLRRPVSCLITGN
ncbi:hypothetical protein TNCV_2570441 [Trichonephila clavipes]|nr:hypothetical protein TNCV_2570441 [Trichonephila clavipes]